MNNLNNLTIEEATVLLEEVQTQKKWALIKKTLANEKAVALEMAGDVGSQTLWNFRKERKMYRLECDDCREKIHALMEFIWPGIND